MNGLKLCLSFKRNLLIKVFIVVAAGIGKLMVMIEYLQKECDRQARKVLEKFKEVREFDKKVL